MCDSYYYLIIDYNLNMSPISVFSQHLLCMMDKGKVPSSLLHSFLTPSSRPTIQACLWSHSPRLVATESGRRLSKVTSIPSLGCWKQGTKVRVGLQGYSVSLLVSVPILLREGVQRHLKKVRRAWDLVLGLEPVAGQEV